MKIVEKPELSERTLKIGIGVISVIMVIALIFVIIDIDTPIVSLVPVWIIAVVFLSEALKELKSKKERMLEKRSE